MGLARHRTHDGLGSSICHFLQDTFLITCYTTSVLQGKQSIASRMNINLMQHEENSNAKNYTQSLV